ncbi:MULTISPECIES: response regulator [Desulfotignum]|jgi:DNA-binding response OmpR family regulator|uniref:Response regulator receiver protein n=1 Tax=Desulfotignum phosphitoxidans DSM 13687 TaxID=1286635 RepID=S0G0J5_9BACT|nr:MULTISPECIES: response regulator [Desulfotignum]EMS80908.1 response regulator receiver protein [Desulfotignum phosphitoxidans DSM 13687]
MSDTVSSRPKVLVIDDEKAISKMLAMALSRKGYDVDTAENGEQGVKKLHMADYDLVITDMRMGKMTGDDVLLEVRQLKGARLPVIAMSGTPWLMENSRFDAVLAKPYQLKDLFDLIRKFIPPVALHTN